MEDFSDTRRASAGGPDPTGAAEPSATSAAPEFPAANSDLVVGSDRLARWLYNHNPFYVISAGLVLHGLRTSFLGGADTFQGREMIVGLMAFTLLLAVTAWLIVRLGSVWDDARTILLLVVLLFVAISVACDFSLADFDSGTRTFRKGVTNFLGGYLFAVVVSEGLLRSLPIRLPWGYRLPYHLFLGLFFLYPVAIMPLVIDAWNRWLPWAVFGFSPAAAVALLTLLPAVRRGAAYVAANGTPWPWPLFPWSLFVILGVAVVLRHYYLCLSFHPVPGAVSTFRPYFLVPPLWAANVLLIESTSPFGVGAAPVGPRLRWARIAALLLPTCLPLLAGYQRGITFWQREFLDQFVQQLGGTPLFFSLLAAMSLYGFAAVRGLPGAADALSAAVAALSVVGPTTMTVSPSGPVQPLALVAAGLIQLYLAERRRSSPRFFAAGCLALIAVSVGSHGTSFTAHSGLLPWHLLVALVLAIGARAGDRFARVWQGVGVALLLLLVLVWAVIVTDSRFSPGWALSVYPLAVALVAAVYGWLVANRAYRAVVVISSCAWLGIGFWHGYQLARQALAGFSYLVGGAVCFLIAAMISLIKAGVPQRWWSNGAPRMPPD
jgi:hypothetical protein